MIAKHSGRDQVHALAKTALAPCPECGATNPVIETDHQFGITWVECATCSIETAFADDEETATKNWNERVGIIAYSRKE